MFKIVMLQNVGNDNFVQSSRQIYIHFFVALLNENCCFREGYIASIINVLLIYFIGMSSIQIYWSGATKVDRTEKTLKFDNKQLCAASLSSASSTKHYELSFTL